MLELSKRTFFGTRINQGLLSFALTQSLMVRSGLFGTIEEAQFQALNGLRFPNPAMPGDTLTVSFEIRGLEADGGSPGFGLMTVALETKNQRGEVIVAAETVHLKRKGGGQK